MIFVIIYVWNIFLGMSKCTRAQKLGGTAPEHPPWLRPACVLTGSETATSSDACKCILECNETLLCDFVQEQIKELEARIAQLKAAETSLKASKEEVEALESVAVDEHNKVVAEQKAKAAHEADQKRGNEAFSEMDGDRDARFVLLLSSPSSALSPLCQNVLIRQPFVHYPLDKDHGTYFWKYSVALLRLSLVSF